MIESDKFGSIKFSDLAAFMIFIQNICLSQKQCTPRCPLKDPYCKCKFVSSPSWLSNMNTYMYSKIAAIYPLFSRIKNKCMFSKCNTCGIFCNSDNHHRRCLFHYYLYKLNKIINDNVGSWRHMR